MKDLESIARKVRKDCIRHVPRNLSPDARQMLVRHIEMAIGKTLGAVRDLIPSGEPYPPEVEMPSPDKEPEVTE